MTILQSLINFDSAKTNFSAKLPISWTPILSDQHQQSKHPQHIHSESINLTKGWKFISSSTNPSSSNANNNNNNNNNFITSNSYSSNNNNNGNKFNRNDDLDDLNVEIYINKPIQIGCLQLKLKFHKELSAPYELRLFRPKKNNEFKSASTNPDLK